MNKVSTETEEHINPMYDSSDTLDAPPQPKPKPAGVALRIPPHTTSTNLPNSYNQENKLDEDAVDIGYTGISSQRQITATSATTAPCDAPVADSSSHILAAARATSHSTSPGSRRLDRSDVIDASLYASADGDSPPGTGSPQAVEFGFDTYTFIDDSNSQTTSASQGEMYAVVNKSRPHRPTTPGSIPSGVRSDENGVVDECNAYAVVDKSSQRRMAGVVSTSPGPSPAKHNAGHDEPSRDVYAQVDKRAKRIKPKPSGQAAAEPEIETYAQVRKPKPGAKPKPLKPKPGVKAQPKPALKFKAHKKPTSHDAGNGDNGVNDRESTGN